MAIQPEDPIIVTDEVEMNEPSVPVMNVRRRLPPWKKPLPTLGNRTSICPFCDAIHWAAERVHSSSVASPRFQTCCKEEERGIHGGIRSFSIHGQIFHQTGGALREGAIPSYAQAYFLDGNEAVDARSNRYNLNPTIVRELTAMIEITNPFVQFYQTAHESLNDSNLEGEHRVVITPHFRLVREEGTDRRLYNLPTTSEFAIVIPDEVDSDQRDVIFYQRNGDGTLSTKFQ